MPIFPLNQLVQARALLQDIRVFMREQTKGHHPMFDYRMVDVFRGLELAHKGLTALVEDKHYTEYDQLREAFRDWPEMDLRDESLREGTDESGS